MGNDQAYIYASNQMAVKLIADPDSVRLKLCPIDADGFMTEVGGTLEADLTRDDINRTIRELKRLRTRVFGRDE